VVLPYNIPSALLLLIAIVIAVAAAGSGQIYVHRRFSDQDFVQHKDLEFSSHVSSFHRWQSPFQARSGSQYSPMRRPIGYSKN
jgi:hypothetical protein